MIDHNELKQEMEYIDTLSRNDRVVLASNRRKDQLATHTKWMKTDDFISTTKSRPKNRKGLKFTLDIELMDIAARNAVDEMRDLLKSGGNPNQMNHDGLTALHQCCIDGSLEMVTLLLKNGANVNVRDRDLWSPLHAAATCGHFKIVTLLIKAGADLTAINGDGDMPHDIAEDEVMQQYLENELAKRGITEDVMDEVRLATRTRMIADINDILSTGGDLDQPLDQGGTFLHVAIANRFHDVVSMLLENGASVSVRDEDGWEPLHAAAYWCNQRAIDMLVQTKDVNIRSPTDIGETPYDICEEPEFKVYILQIISDISNKYSSVKSYSSPNLRTSFNREESLNESDDELSSNFNDDYEDTVTDTLIFNIPKDHRNTYEIENEHEKEDNSDEDQWQLNKSNNENATVDAPSSNPLLNLQASEFSERRNSVKEAKHLAPLKRANSQDRHYLPNDISIIQKGYENAPLPPTETTDGTRGSTNGLAAASARKYVMENEKTSTRTMSDTSSAHNGTKNISLRNATDNAETTVKTRVSSNGIVSNNRGATSSLPPRYSMEDEHMDPTVKTPHSKPKAPLPSPVQRPQHSETNEMNNKDSTKSRSPNQISLLDLKRQRREAREIHSQTSYSQSTFYNATQIYEPPPSPTMIRYRFKMDTEEIVHHSIIKEKKCTIM